MKDTCRRHAEYMQNTCKIHAGYMYMLNRSAPVLDVAHTRALGLGLFSILKSVNFDTNISSIKRYQASITQYQRYQSISGSIRSVSDIFCHRSISNIESVSERGL